jgi:hypothetical protein
MHNVSIRRFRKPKHSYQHHKSEVASRHSAFTRGSAYLERYCLLIAFGAYLEEVAAGMAGGLAAYKDDTLPSFADWLNARPELNQVCLNVSHWRASNRLASKSAA